jgi:hypothetical protein
MPPAQAVRDHPHPLSDSEILATLADLGDKAYTTRIGARAHGTDRETRVVEHGYIHLLEKNGGHLWHFADRHRPRAVHPFNQDATISWTAVTKYTGPRARTEREASCGRGREQATVTMRDNLQGYQLVEPPTPEELEMRELEERERERAELEQMRARVRTLEEEAARNAQRLAAPRPPMAALPPIDAEPRHNDAPPEPQAVRRPTTPRTDDLRRQLAASEARTALAERRLAAIEAQLAAPAAAPLAAPAATPLAAPDPAPAMTALQQRQLDLMEAQMAMQGRIAATMAQNMDPGNQIVHQANMTAAVKGEGQNYVKVTTDGLPKTTFDQPDEFMIFSPWHLLHADGTRYEGDMEQRFRQFHQAAVNAFPVPPTRERADGKEPASDFTRDHQKHEDACVKEMLRQIKAQHMAALPLTKQGWEAVHHPALMLFKAFFGRRFAHKRVVNASAAWDTKWRSGTIDPAGAYASGMGSGGQRL